MFSTIFSGTLCRAPSATVAPVLKRLIAPSHRVSVVIFRQLSVSSSRGLARNSPRGASSEKATYNTTPTASDSPVRPTATWLTTKGAGLDLDRVLKQLPQLDPYKNPQQAKSLTTALFLVTPQLAHLFEPGNNFHAAAIGRIFPSLVPGLRRQSIVAVVDALPAVSMSREPPAADIHGYEGLAVCVSTHFHTGPEDKMHVNRTPVITLTSRAVKIDQPEARLTISYQASVANTLFVNGRTHTMFSQHWVGFEGKNYEEETHRQYLSSLEIPIYSRRDRVRPPTSLWMELVRLTRPATIVTSMGNIIRQIATEDGTIMAASHELERVIPPLVKSKHEKYPNMELRVFALVYPPDIERRAKGMFSFKESNVEGELNSDLTRVVLHKLILRGARLYRVTSGGAGWGNKAGLLSLEPATELNAKDNISHDFEPSFDFQADSIRMPGSADLFPLGHVVQFVASWHDPNGEHTDGLTIADLPLHTQWLRSQYFEGNELQKFCVGTTVMPELLGDPPRSTEAEQKAIQIFCPNRFGFLTTSSMSLSIESASGSDQLLSRHSTLVDVPNTSFIATWPASGEEKDVADDVVRKHSKHNVVSSRKIEPSRKGSEVKSKASSQVQEPNAKQKKDEPKKVIAEIGQEMAVQDGRVKPNSKSTPGPRIVKVHAGFYNHWERVKMKLDKRRKDEDDPKSTPISQGYDTKQHQDSHSQLVGSQKVGESKHQHEERTKDNNATKTETGTTWGRSARGTKLHETRAVDAGPHIQKVQKIFVRRGVDPRGFEHITFRGLRKAGITKHYYGLPFVVQRISTNKASIRTMPDDDPRVTSRMPGPRYTKDEMDGLIRVRGTDPVEFEPEKDFNSLFYRDRELKEDEAIDDLLNDLETSGSEQLQKPDLNTGPHALQLTPDTQEERTNIEVNDEPEQVSGVTLGRRRRNANRRARMRLKAAEEGAKLGADSGQHESKEEVSRKPGVTSPEDFFRSFER